VIKPIPHVPIFSAEDVTAFVALEVIDAAMLSLRNGALTRERAQEALRAILGHVESACAAYAAKETL
jgi:hypothetical protein